MDATCRSPRAKASALTFGKYRLLRRLARGGMGEVFLATLPGALGFEKTLVVKTILPQLARRERFVDLFAAEAKTAVALSHGNIVPIYELGQHGDTLYIAMGYVDGPSLSALLRAHRRRHESLDLAAALFITRQILTGMAYAHSAEPGRPPVVHRDLSPRNVLIDRSGQVRIVDFGIAMPAHAAVDARMGSAGYVAPEQARAEAPDPRADVFSVGCLLYELLTLERAFPKEGVWVMPDLDPVPPDLRPALTAALALDPAARPADAGAFLDALAEAMARHAATYNERDLAAHLRRMFAQGWDEPDAAPTAPDAASTPATPATVAATAATAVTPAGTRTFATRLHDDPLPSGPAPRPARRHRALLAGAAATLLVLGTAWFAWTQRAGFTQPAPHVREPVAHGSPGPPTAQAAPPPDGSFRAAPHRPRAASIGSAGAEPPRTPAVTDGASAPASGTAPNVRRAPGATKGAARPATVPAPGARTEPAHLTVLTPALPWAEVYVDGTKVAHTPLVRHPLPPGRHRVRVRCHPDICNPARDLHDGSLRFAPGKTRTLRLQ